MIPALKTRLSQSNARYANLRDRIRPLVTRWEWAYYPRYMLEPFGMWHVGHPQPGRLINSEPKSKNGKYHHGYDANNRMVLTEQYGDRERPFYETFLEYSEDRIESHHYGDRIVSTGPPLKFARDCINVETLLLADGRPIAFLRYAVGGHKVVVYEYDQGRIVHFWEGQQQGTGAPRSDRRRVTRGTVVYDGNSLEQIELESEDGSVWVILKDGRCRSVALLEKLKHQTGPQEIPTITPRSVKKDFQLFVEKAGHELPALSLEIGIELMFAFYRDERVKGCSVPEDGDMLIFQWGNWTWPTREATFYVNIARHLTVTDKAFGGMRQLGLNFLFPMTDGLRALKGSLDRLCMTPDELDEFRRLLRDTAAWRAVAPTKPVKVVLTLDQI
jgi:hypothetical protein